MLLDRIARRSQTRFRQGLSQAETCTVDLAGREVLLLKPTTYMNRSGRAVREVLARYPVQISDLIVIYDEIALPLGKLRLRPRGSAGGHNGMKSILELLGSQEISRLRIGVAGEKLPSDLADYVLSDFEPDERVTLDETLERAREAIVSVLDEGIEIAMSKFN